MAPNIAKSGKRNKKKNPLDFGGLDPNMMMVSTHIFISHDHFIVLDVSPQSLMRRIPPNAVTGRVELLDIIK